MHRKQFSALQISLVHVNWDELATNLTGGQALMLDEQEVFLYASCVYENTLHELGHKFLV